MTHDNCEAATCMMRDTIDKVVANSIKTGEQILSLKESVAELKNSVENLIHDLRPITELRVKIEEQARRLTALEAMVEALNRRVYIGIGLVIAVSAILKLLKG